MPSSHSSPESAPSTTFHEAIMDSVSSVRDSLPKQYHEHFNTLRQEIIDFAQAHNIPRESLAKPNALREAANKLSTQDLERLATLFERFEYLLVHKEPRREKVKPLEYVEKFYHLTEQYNFQVALLEEIGVLEDGAILGIDGNEYPIPTLEQITARLFENKERLSIKHDQGFTKFLLVPFGTSLDHLVSAFRQFLLDYAKKHPDFLQDENPLFVEHSYVGADVGDEPSLVYNPRSFPPEYQYQTKEQILEDQSTSQCFAPGWRVLLLQSPDDAKKKGFASIPEEHFGTTRGSKILRPDIEADKTADEYLHLLLKNQDHPDSPYEGESGMTPEDWILAYMIHLIETGEPLDCCEKDGNSRSFLVGAYFLSKNVVPTAFGSLSSEVAILGFLDHRAKRDFIGSRFVVEV